MRIALAQLNPTVGDLAGNVGRMTRASRDAAARGAEVVVFPELSITGYPPRDLVEKPAFLESCERELDRLARETADLGLSVICGYVGRSEAETGKRALNRAALIEHGEVVFRQSKMLLPNYDVFDEARYFRPAEREYLCTLRGTPVALTICEDAWNDRRFWKERLYQRDPVEELFEAGAQMLICINASPYSLGKRAIRRSIYRAAARRYAKPVIYVNQVGGNDQLVFDGTSFAMNNAGEVIAAGRTFEEDLIVCDLDAGTGDRHEDFGDECAAAYQALVTGTRDYIRKCGFSKVLIGLSGGIDSALTAVIAVDAVGKENVTGVGMPGPYSSAASITDARDMAEKLGIRFEIVSITGAYERFEQELIPLFQGTQPGVTEENLQSRLRGVTLMALSNNTGAMVLTTGNKSELAVGYCTLYGDMCGGLAVISDVPKTLVYKLARIANQRHEGAIPESVFTKPPSAELRPDQRDTDSLPPYDVLDPILEAYVEQYRTPREIASSLNLPLELVQDIVNKVDRNEYKRQQAAPGLKVTTKAFGVGPPDAHRSKVFRMKFILFLAAALSAFALDFPMSLAVAPDGRVLALSGGAKPSISVVNGVELPLPDAWLGLTFAPNGKMVYAGGGSRGVVYEFSYAQGELTPIREMKAGDFTGDVALSPDGHLVYAADLFGNVIVVINPQSGRVIDHFKTGRRPYRILFHPDGRSYFVSSWADASVYQYNTVNGAEIGRIRVGSHPTDMALSGYVPESDGPGGQSAKYRLFVAAANTNEVFSVGIGDNNTMNLLETIHVAAAPVSPLGMTPSALALSADQKHLYVACSDADVVASVDVSDVRGVVEGFLPAGAYPAAVRSSGDRVWVASARANTVEALGQTFQTVADAPILDLAPADHVIYVLRDPRPEPLMRAIGGLAPDFTVKLGSRPRFDIADPANFPPAGYLWTNALAAGLSVRDYGVFVRDGKAIDPAARAFTKPDASTFADDLKQFDSSGMMPRLILVQIAGDEALASLKSAVAKSRFAAKTEVVVGDLRRVEALLGLHPMTRKD